jgi:hypothetical protein
MKNRLLNLACIPVLLLFCTPGLLAQKNNLTVVGSEINSGNGFYHVLKTFADLDGNVFICGGGTDTKRTDQFAKNMVEKTSRKSVAAQSQYISFTLPGEELPVPAYTFAMLNDKLYAFTETLGLKERTLYGCEIDKTTLQLTGNPVKIFTFSVSAIKKQYLQNEFPEVRSSLGEEKLLFSFFEKKNEDDPGTMHVKVYEHDLQLAWAKELSGPTTTGTFFITEFKIYDNGDLQITGRNKQLVESRNNKKEYNMKSHIMLYSDHGESIVDREISLPKAFICSMFSEMLDNGKMIVSGSYISWDGEKKGPPGIYYMAFQPGETKPLFSETNNIDPALIPDDMYQTVFNGTGFEEFPSGTFMRSIFVKQDGSLVLIGEHTSIKINDDGIKELIVFGLNSEGKLIWTKQIFKSQEIKGLSDYWINSFKAFAYGDDIIIFFNDNLDNSLTKNDPKAEDFKGLSSPGMLVVCTITPKGEMVKQKAYQFEAQKAASVRTMIQTGPDEFAFLNYYEKLKPNINYTQMK